MKLEDFKPNMGEWNNYYSQTGQDVKRRTNSTLTKNKKLSEKLSENKLGKVGGNNESEAVRGNS